MRALCLTDDGFDEPETLAVLGPLLDEALVFPDIGANQGVFTLVAAARDPRVHVHAFEANPGTATLLREHVALNGFTPRVQVHERAVADHPGTVEFRVPPSPFAAHGAILDVDSVHSGSVVREEAVTRPCTSAPAPYPAESPVGTRRKRLQALREAKTKTPSISTRPSPSAARLTGKNADGR